ncbi:MAG: polyprenyl synthetase family protein [Candidatus Tectomicrobia bacterium]|uniref:Polyprenyl synthetase family protein n=1 Tax=Tectimicrobiota bacterium TaxID=2528274 RepID=A0A937W039_UNCTE|nr:polyprenyl synthetase family protein [Candidatus Tectomicrobia bacterium]
MESLEEYLEQQRLRVEASLDQCLPSSESYPPQLMEAMRYSVFAGGKRLRPILTLTAAEAVGGDSETALPAAAALEYIHTYSMIHDDLPAMDDDDYRRGKLTNHKVYGEAMAILAGDGLLTHAFEVLSSPPLTDHFPATVLQQVSYRMARAAGSFGMIGGQVMDVLSEGQQVPIDVLEYIHRHKTAALITAAVTMGGILGGGTAEQLQALERYGHDVGWAFQIADDLLDVEGDAAVIGKQVGRDAALEKVTYPGLLGVEASRQRATALMQQGIAALASFGPRAERLRQIATYIVSRNV